MLVINKVQILLDTFLGLVRKYVLEIIVLMFMNLFILWSFAFLANGLYNFHFDLASCWGGFSAIGGAGFLAAVKYCTDSWKNSPGGFMPSYGVLKDFDTDHDGKVTFSELAATFTAKAQEFANKNKQGCDKP